MNKVSLKGKDFTTVHNTLCELRELSNRDKRVKRKEIKRLVRQFELGLRDAYDQDNKIEDAYCDYWRGVADQNNYDAIWAVSGVKSCRQDHPYQNYTFIRYDAYWGKQLPVQVPINGSTWLDMYQAADQVIRMSGDNHHIFIEGFYEKDGYLMLSTGS